jgi:hypothetical protein
MIITGTYELPIDVPNALTKGSKRSSKAISKSIPRAVFTSNEYKFEITQQPAYLIVKVRAKSSIDLDQASIRISEALEFIFGIRMEYFTLELYNSSGTTHILKTPVPLDRNGYLDQALQPNMSSPDDFWLLFEKYLIYISEDQSHQVHPTSRIIKNLIEATAASIYTQSLVLGVSVEDLLNVNFEKIGKPSNRFLKQLQTLENFVNNTRFEEEFQNRLRGSLSTMKLPRVKDKLRELQKKGVVTKAQYKAWDEVRNATAHGDYQRLGTTQEVLLLNGTVLTLFYHLIFQLIRYKGSYTDYSELGWPTRRFPTSNS